MADQWYYAQQGKRIGPVSRRKLGLLAKSGDITPDDLVWKKDMRTRETRMPSSTLVTATTTAKAFLKVMKRLSSGIGKRRNEDMHSPSTAWVSATDLSATAFLMTMTRVQVGIKRLPTRAVRQPLRL